MNDETEKNPDWWKDEVPPPKDLWAEAGFPQLPPPAPVSDSPASESDEEGDDTPEPPWWQQKGLPYDPSPNSAEGKSHLRNEAYRQKWLDVAFYKKRLWEAVEHVIPPGELRRRALAALHEADDFDKTVENIRKGLGAIPLFTAVRSVVEDDEMFRQIYVLVLPPPEQED